MRIARSEFATFSLNSELLPLLWDNGGLPRKILEELIVHLQWHFYRWSVQQDTCVRPFITPCGICHMNC